MKSSCFAFGAGGVALGAVGFSEEQEAIAPSASKLEHRPRFPTRRMAACFSFRAENQVIRGIDATGVRWRESRKGPHIIAVLEDLSGEIRGAPWSTMRLSKLSLRFKGQNFTRNLQMVLTPRSSSSAAAGPTPGSERTPQPGAPPRRALR